MKKSIPIIREWESEAFILGNGREREFPLTPDSTQDLTFVNMTLNCPQTFKSYPSLMKITFLVDLLCLAIFSLEAIIKTKRRGLLVDGGYLRSR